MTHGGARRKQYGGRRSSGAGKTNRLLKLSNKTKTRIQGARELAGIAAGRNPVYGSAKTAYDAGKATYKVVKGKQPAVRVGSKKIRL